MNPGTNRTQLEESIQSCCKSLFLTSAIPELIKSEGTPKQVEYLCAALRKEVIRREENRRSRLVKRAHFPTYKTFEGYRVHSGSGPRKKLVKSFLDEHYKEKLSLESVASHFFIDKHYLARLFKEQYGVTLVTYLQQVRITHAKRMLRFTDKSIEEIGLECGIGELNYFSRVFKKLEGVSPSEFRREEAQGVRSK